MSKEKFLRVYANLPTPEREQVIAVIDGITYSWSVAHIEISNDTLLGKKNIKEDWGAWTNMISQKLDIEKGQRELVIARFKTLNPNAELSCDDTEFTMKELIGHVEKGDDFGRQIVQAQIKMLKVLGEIS